MPCTPIDLLTSSAARLSPSSIHVVAPTPKPAAWEYAFNSVRHAAASMLHAFVSCTEKYQSSAIKATAAAFPVISSNWAATSGGSPIG